MNLRDMPDKELAKLLMVKDTERKDNIDAEKLYWECVKEASHRYDLEEGLEHEEEEDMLYFLEKVIEICDGAAKGIDILFQCPLCQKHAIAYIDPKSGIKHGHCLNCDMVVAS